MKHKGADQNQQRRQQPHLIRVFDVADEVEDPFKGRIEEHDQSYGKSAEEDEIVSSEESHVQP